MRDNSPDTTPTLTAPPLFFTGTPPQGSFPERLKRIQALSKLDSPSAVQELTAALTGDNETIRWLAASTLRQLGGPQVADVLQSFVEQTDSASARAEAQQLLTALTRD